MIPGIPSSGKSLFSALESAQRGMNGAVQALDADAASVASDGPTVENMVDLVLQPHLFAANARVIRSAAEMSGTAVDLLA